MDVVVVGAGIAGLGTALHLGKAGHRVTLLERDPAPPADPEEAWESWERRGVPQSRLAHVFMGRMRNAIRDEHPEIYRDLMDAGAEEIRQYDMMPATVTDRTRLPVDDDLAILGMRRVVFEHHLRGAIAALPSATIRSGTAVSDVVAGAPVDGIPRVVGVALEDGTTIAADLVVDCSGRRSPLPQWLTGLGSAAPPEEVTEDGLMYFGRYYQLEDGQSYPAQEQVIVDLGYLFGLTFKADRGWFAIALAVHSEDKAIRALRDEDAYEAALQAIPHTAAWRQPGQSRPMTEVKTMSRIDDRWRDLVVDGRPLVIGLVAVGDSVVATNPAFGRGSTLAWLTGRALVDIVAEHGDDPVALALAHHAATHALVRSWYDMTASMDAGRLEVMRALLAGEPVPEPDPDDPFATFGIGLQLASTRDPLVYRAMGHVVNMLKDPVEIVSDPDVAAKAIEAFLERDSYEGPPAGPSRDELLAAMSGSPAAAG